MFYRTLLASDVIRVSDEDLSSQLNHVWSTLLLTAMGLLISMVQYVGDPIHCLCPASMPEVHCNYTKALCWVKENYYHDEDDTSPLHVVTSNETRIAYYPWAPWILFFMAAALKLPHIIWSSFVPQSDLDLNNLVFLADAEEDMDNLAKVIRIWLIRTKRHYTDVFHTTKRLLSLIGLFWLGHHKRTFLTGLVIHVKIMYLAVSLGLFFSLNLFLDEDFTSYGWEVLQDFFQGLPQISPKFPRQIICNIKIRQMNNVNKFSIQCILPINIYNQKIFVFIWFWFIFLTIINAGSLVGWCYRLLSPYQRWKFVNHYVHIFSHFDRKFRRHRGRSDRSLNGNAIRLHTVPNGGLITYREEQGFVLNLGHEDEGEEEGRDQGASSDLRSRRGSLSSEYSVFKPKKRKRMRPKPILSSIEVDQHQLNETIVKRDVNVATALMLKRLGHDGVLVFRTLESAVGIVIANQIFHKLHDQIMAGIHHSET